MIPADHRQERDAGQDRREPEVLLQVVGEEQEHGEDRDRRQRHRQVRAAAVAVRAPPAAAAAGGVERRSTSHERDEQHDGDGEHRRASCVLPQLVVDACEKPYTRANSPPEPSSVPGMSIRGRSSGRTLCQQRQRAEHPDPGEQQVDVQAPPPRQVLGEHAAEQQADRRAAAGQRAEHAERLAALVGLGERRRRAATAPPARAPRRTRPGWPGRRSACRSSGRRRRAPRRARSRPGRRRTSTCARRSQTAGRRAAAASRRPARTR